MTDRRAASPVWPHSQTVLHKNTPRATKTSHDASHVVVRVTYFATEPACRRSDVETEWDSSTETVNISLKLPRKAVLWQ